MALVMCASWCCASESNQPGTITGKLAAVKYFHSVEVGIDRVTDSPRLKRLMGGIKRVHAENGSGRDKRLPISLDVLLHHGGMAHQEWGPGGRAMYLSLLVMFFFGARATEVFKGDKGTEMVHCLTRGSVSFFAGTRRLGPESWLEANRAEVCFASHKGDQERKGTVLVRTRDSAIGAYPGVTADGCAVAVLVELLSLDKSLSAHAPLSAFRTKGTVKVWDIRQAAVALRKIASRAGMDTKRVSLHSI